MMKIQMPAGAAKIIAQLKEHGFDAYVVGGCVRDSVLGRVPGDWDITTDAKPEDMKRIFAYTVDTGIEHGTVTVLIDREGYEVTTYRIDGVYTDSRHPDEVTFTDNLSEDLRRRDFTINAMAYNDDRGLVDVFGGMEDLKQKVIRCVGCASSRFTEDALRILRAVRFSAQLDFTIEKETADAACKLAPRLQNISAERIAAEMVKLLESDHPDRVQAAYQLGLTAQFLPELKEVSEVLLKGIMEVSAQRELRMAMLLWDQSAETARKVLRRLKFDNVMIRTVTGLRTYGQLLDTLEENDYAVRKAMHVVGVELFELLFEVWRGRSVATQSDGTHLRTVRGIFDTIVERGDCVNLKMMAVSGADLIAIGAKPGVELGELLKQLLEQVLGCPEKNTKETLLQMAAEIME